MFGFVILGKLRELNTYTVCVKQDLANKKLRDIDEHDKLALSQGAK